MQSIFDHHSIPDTIMFAYIDVLVSRTFMSIELCGDIG